jgi:hypothetical protein
VIRTAFAAAALVLGSSAHAATQAAARPAARAAAVPTDGGGATGMISFSLIDALAALHKPELAGIFSFVSEQNAPFAFADLLARDKKGMKLYLDKLDGDQKAAKGLTEWDHAVLASLINLYGSPMAATFGKPDEKILHRINTAMLAQTVPLEAIVAGRKK